MTAAAKADLAEIWFYLAVEASEAVANRLIAKIERDCEPLRRFPLSAPSREQLAPGVRVGFSGAYAVYYRHDKRELVIIRVLHGARDASALARYGGFAVPDEP